MPFNILLNEYDEESLPMRSLVVFQLKWIVCKGQKVPEAADNDLALCIIQLTVCLLHNNNLTPSK